MSTSWRKDKSNFVFYDKNVSLMSVLIQLLLIKFQYFITNGNHKSVKGVLRVPCIKSWIFICKKNRLNPYNFLLRSMLNKRGRVNGKMFRVNVIQSLFQILYDSTLNRYWYPYADRKVLFFRVWQQHSIQINLA